MPSFDISGLKVGRGFDINGPRFGLPNADVDIKNPKIDEEIDIKEPKIYYPNLDDKLLKSDTKC